MSKFNTGITRVNAFHTERETTRVITLEQRRAMDIILHTSALDPTGYEPVPMAVLRDDPSVHKLLDMMETCRPADSKSETDYIAKYIDPLKPFVDGYGNRIITINSDDPSYPRILWSSHTDTVHWHDGTQRVEVNHGMAWTPDGSCLGSDDTVGNWLALEMIAAKVPGTYVFHREEECGGGGSMWLAKNAGDWLGDFQCAIALDRANYGDVITHQAGGRCCSDVFAQSIADLIGGKFAPCDRGVFTDTANYVDVIGECTNISVGYFRQHGVMEHTNLSFAVSLRDALLQADWTKLGFERQPGEDDPWYLYDDKYGSTTYVRPKGKPRQDDPLDLMEEYVRNYPWIVAEYLVAMGIGTDDIDEFDPSFDADGERL
jgi:hypothetical protein